MEARRVTELDVDDVLDLLADASGQPLGPDLSVSQLDHALQTAARLETERPGDTVLAAAGLVHDIGHLLPGSSDETHGQDAARAVRRVLGERVAGIVALHVEAKRLLVATDPAYTGLLGSDSVSSLARQGGTFGAEAAAAFVNEPWAADAVTLRRADDAAKVAGVDVGDLTRWVPL
ncbi:MAG: HD domain-containing protein, partial [Acidimicrobiales bacterium]|nr:HD domain-containing protein [Acidimicrobiales bacterium]